MYTVEWIRENEGFEYIYIDISLCEASEFSGMLVKSGEMIRKRPEKSVYILTFVSEKTPIFTDIKGFHNYLNLNQPYVKASAVAVTEPFRKAMFEGVIALSGRNIKVTSTVEEAKEYLVKTK